MKVYFAGMETMLAGYGHKGFEIKTTDNVFGTFFNEKATTKMLEEFEQRNHKGLITVDSGAHTFFGFAGTSGATHHRNSQKDKIPDPDVYVRNYFDWVKTHWDRLSYFVELDIQEIIGLERVKAWREIMKKEGLYKKCITVYHKVDTFDDYMAILEESESGYVALEGLWHKKMWIPYTRCLREAYARGIKVHGFALTSSDITHQFPFYSVDSTTWTNILQFGSTLVMDRFGVLRQKSPSKDNYLKYNIPVHLFNIQRTEESRVAKLNYAAEKYREYEEFLTAMWKARGVKWKD